MLDKTDTCGEANGTETHGAPGKIWVALLAASRAVLLGAQDVLA